MDWNDHVIQSVTLMKRDLRHHQLEFKLIDRPILVRIDEKLMEHAIGNLVANSINYAPRGTTIVIETGLETSRGGPLAFFAIADQGHGIPKEHHDRIFEKFYRIPGSRPGGTGLGLALVQQILQEHDGSIQLDTEYKSGARFILRVPTSEVTP